MAKRVFSAIIGMAILLTVILLNNLVVINIAVTIIGLIGLSEFYNVFKKKGYKPCEMIGYIFTLPILGIGFVETEIIKIFLFIVMPIILFILFCKSIFTNMKYNIIDIAITLLGIIYVPFLISFISFICHLNNGHYYIWYVLAAAWATDTAAYLIGIKFGKHKISKISPKKSVEGCIGGVIGCVAFYMGYTYYLSTVGIELNYMAIAFLGVVASIIAQIGDFAASSIKRFCDEKDFGTIMPGHGGVLDRFDSLLMVSPFLYMFFQFMI